MLLEFIQAPDAASLIADSGQPNLPGWEVIAALLMAATVAVLLSTQPTDPARRHSNRVRPPITRLAKAQRVGPRAGNANAVRGLSLRRVA